MIPQMTRTAKTRSQTALVLLLPLVRLQALLIPANKYLVLVRELHLQIVCSALVILLVLERYLLVRHAVMLSNVITSASQVICTAEALAY